MTKVSVVTVSFNQGQFLEQSIQSVLSQDYPDLEYIVVDAGSTDGSREIIERYRSRLARVVLEPDRGPADGLNKGFAYAQGDVFGYLNADDIYLAGAIRGAVAVLEGSGGDLVYGDGYIMDEGGRYTRRCLSTPYKFHRLALQVGTLVMQQSTFFRASAFRDIGGFNPENRRCWDGELFFRFAATRKKIVRVKRYWSAFRIHPASLTGSGRDLDQYRRDCARIYGPSQARYGRLLPLFRVAARIEARLAILDITFLRLKDRLLGPPGVEKLYR